MNESKFHSCDEQMEFRTVIYFTVKHVQLETALLILLPYIIPNGRHDAVV